MNGMLNSKNILFAITIVSFKLLSIKNIHYKCIIISNLKLNTIVFLLLFLVILLMIHVNLPCTIVG